MTRAFLPRMKEKKKGHIVFINSMASLTPVGGGSIYSVTKFGLLGKIFRRPNHHISIIFFPDDLFFFRRPGMVFARRYDERSFLRGNRHKGDFGSSVFRQHGRLVFEKIISDPSEALKNGGCRRPNRDRDTQRIS